MKPSQRFLFWFLITALLPTSSILAQSSTPRDSTWMTNGPVYAVAYSKGITYIGGDFTYVGPNSGHGAAINTTTGTPDLKFPRVNGTIFVVTPDGADGWYIGGQFTKVGNFTRNGLAHIKADGTVDPSWDPNSTGGGDPTNILTIAESGATIYVGGQFTSLGGQPRNNIAAINATTGLVTSWNPNASRPIGSASSASVNVIVIHEGTAFVGGNFFSIGGKGRQHLAAIDITTGNATSWVPALNWPVNAIIVSDTLVFVGGQFTKAGGQNRNHLAAFGMASGKVSGWNPGANGPVYVFALNGARLYVGGSFSGTGGKPRNGIAALSLNSNVPQDWNPNANGAVQAISIMGSTIYIGGGFTNIGGQARNHIAALDATTGKAITWTSHMSAPVRALALNNNGSVLYAGGDFRSIGGQLRNRLAALDAATGIATAWNPNVNGSVHAITPSGSNIYIGGKFTEIGGAARNRIAALNAATGAVTAWKLSANGNVYAITIDNSTLYVGGGFSAIGGQTRNRLAAIDIATGLAKSWHPNVNVGSTVYAVLVHDTTVYAAGDFYGVGNQTRQALAAIDARTGQASSWNPNLNLLSIVYTMALDGSTLYVGGDFSDVKGQTRNRLAAIDITTADPTAWNPNANGNVRTLVMGGDNVYVGGAFTDIGGIKRNYFAAIDRITGAPTGWNPNPNVNGFGQCLAVVGSAVLAGGSFRTMEGDIRDYFAQFGNIVVTNLPPNAPFGLNQFRLNGTTVIPEGGVTTQPMAIFKGTISDPDDEPVKLQIELRKITEPFTGVPTRESLLVNSETLVSIFTDTLVAVGYKWRYRVMDGRGLATDWVEFGAAGNTDFVVNLPPRITAVNQFKSSGMTALPEGGTTNENKIMFKATVSDPSGAQVKLEIELRKLNEAFTGMANLQSDLVNSGGQVTIIRDNLVSANYKWRYRARNAKGLASDWKEFGVAGNTDFIVIQEIPIYVAVVTPQASGTEFWIDVKVGDSANPVANLFGLSFVLYFAPTEYIDVVTPYDQTVIPGSFLGNDVIFYQTVEENTNSINVGISRKVGQGGVNNVGGVLRVKFRAHAHTPQGTSVQFNILNVSANDPNGNPITLTPRLKTITINNANTNPIVWPGDTNNDGVVNQKDILPLGLYWGKTGPARAEASINWISQACQPWTPAAATYADATGDGKVDQAEISPIGLNWGKSHAPISLLAQPEMDKAHTRASASIAPKVIPAEQAPNHEFAVRISIADVADLFGLSFELVYDQPQLVKALVVEPDSLFGHDVVFYSHLDGSNGKIAAGISRKAGQSGVNGAGAVVRVKAKISADAAPGTKINFTLHTVTANDAQGAAIPLHPQSSTLTIGRVTAVDFTETALPASYRLHPNHPNPFRTGTLIRYEIAQPGQVMLQIYNLAGQEILQLANEVQQPGRYQINWNGRDHHHQTVPSGIYVCRLQAGSFVQTQRMVVVR